MRANKTKLFASVLVRLIIIFIIGILYYRVTAIIEDVFRPSGPPSAILQAQNMEQTAELGTFYWDGIFGDVLGIITPRDALVVSSPFNAKLKLLKDTPPSDVRLDVIITKKLKKVSYEKKSSYDVWNTSGAPIKNSILLEKSLLPQEEQTINLELESGLYIILIHASWEQDVVEYGFLVDLK